MRQLLARKNLEPSGLQGREQVAPCWDAVRQFSPDAIRACLLGGPPGRPLMSGARSAVRVRGPRMSLQTHAGVRLEHVLLALGVSSAQSDLRPSKTSFGSPAPSCLGLRLPVCEASELRRAQGPPGLRDHSTPVEARRLIGGDNVLTVWAKGGSAAGRCSARQAFGVRPDQRRKARVKALASE